MPGAPVSGAGSDAGSGKCGKCDILKFAILGVAFLLLAVSAATPSSFALVTVPDSARPEVMKLTPNVEVACKKQLHSLAVCEKTSGPGSPACAGASSDAQSCALAASELAERVSAACRPALVALTNCRQTKSAEECSEASDAVNACAREATTRIVNGE